MPPRPRSNVSGRDCPLCHDFVPDGFSLTVLAKHFQVCPVLASPT